MEPIHNAASQADVDALRRLLGEGISPNAEDADGLMPLHHLCADKRDADKRVTCLNILVDAGADINAGINTPLSLAARQGHPKLVSKFPSSKHVLMDNRGYVHGAAIERRIFEGRAWRAVWTSGESCRDAARAAARAAARLLRRRGRPVDDVGLAAQ